MSSERLVRTTALLSTPLGEETIRVHPATSRFYSLSRAGSPTWDALADPRTEAEVVAYALSPFPHTPSSAASATASLPQADPLLLPPPALGEAAVYAANGVSGANDGQATGFGGPLLS
jgi:hypothetical protein